MKTTILELLKWSERWDSNPRPLHPDEAVSNGYSSRRIPKVDSKVRTTEHQNPYFMVIFDSSKRLFSLGLAISGNGFVVL